MVEAPLAVWAGEKEPHSGGLVQVAIQSTPALAASLVTVAATKTKLPVTIELGGGCVRETDTSGVVVEALLTFAPVSAHPPSPMESPVTTTSKRAVHEPKRNLLACVPVLWGGEVRHSTRRRIPREREPSFPHRSRFSTRARPFPEFRRVPARGSRSPEQDLKIPHHTKNGFGAGFSSGGARIFF